MLAALPPAQLLFVALRSLSKAYPVWASLAIWRMARNPLQYSWLVLLVVMVTGLGILATTVGGTLDRSYEERVLYEVAADLRITGVPSYSTQGNESMKRRYLAMPGVSSVSLALRGEGSVGATYSGNAFNVLAVESEEFPYMSWYRDDFSVRPLPQVMSLLRTGANLPAITLPEGADTLHVWARPVEEYSNIYLWMVIQDKRGITETITFGPVIGAEWALMESQVPRHLQSPMSLVSVQIYEPAFGPGGTAGTILLDDIHATANGGETHMLDDFEGQNNWTPLSTSMISRDTIGFTRREVKNGERSGAFVFGKDTDRGIRGFYRSPSGGPVPVVASASFARRTGTAAGDSIIVNVFSRLIPVRIMDTVDYFPTMNPAGNGFLISDLEAILRHLNILSPVGSIHPNELLVDEAPGSEDEVYRLALSLAAAPDMVHHRARPARCHPTGSAHNGGMARHDARGSVHRHIRYGARLRNLSAVVLGAQQKRDGLPASSRLQARSDDSPAQRRTSGDRSHWTRDRHGGGLCDEQRHGIRACHNRRRQAGGAAVHTDDRLGVHGGSLRGYVRHLRGRAAVARALGHAGEAARDGALGG